jgi:hypothetical protein
LCLIAVKNDDNGYALDYVPNDPPEYLQDRIKRELNL